MKSAINKSQGPRKKFCDWRITGWNCLIEHAHKSSFICAWKVWVLFLLYSAAFLVSLNGCTNFRGSYFSKVWRLIHRFKNTRYDLWFCWHDMLLCQETRMIMTSSRMTSDLWQQTSQIKHPMVFMVWWSLRHLGSSCFSGVGPDRSHKPNPLLLHMSYIYQPHAISSSNKFQDVLGTDLLYEAKR